MIWGVGNIFFLFGLIKLNLKNNFFFTLKKFKKNKRKKKRIKQKKNKKMKKNKKKKKRIKKIKKYLWGSEN